MDTATEVKNQKILLATIRRDIIEASTALTSLYADKTAIDSEILESKQELIKNQVASDSIFAAIEGEKESLRKTERDSVNGVERAKKEMKVLGTQKKESMKELRRANEWVYTAQEEAKKLNTSIASLVKEEALKKAYIADTEVFKDMRDEAEEAYKEILLDAKLITDETEAKRHNCEQEVSKAEEKLGKLKEDTKLAKQELNTFVREKNKKEKDLGIYINRVEVAYKKQFPNKAFKL